MFIILSIEHFFVCLICDILVIIYTYLIFYTYITHDLFVCVSVFIEALMASRVLGPHGRRKAGREGGGLQGYLSCSG
jgi:hypothetical protein